MVSPTIVSPTSMAWVFSFITPSEPAAKSNDEKYKN